MTAFESGVIINSPKIATQNPNPVRYPTIKSVGSNNYNPKKHSNEPIRNNIIPKTILLSFKNTQI